jgi:hypothetical protein
MRGATGLPVLGLVTAMACNFEPSGGSGAPGEPGSPDASGTIGGDPGDPDAASGDPGGADGAASAAQVVTPVGAATTVGDLGGNGGEGFNADCGAGHVITGLDAEDNDFGLCRLRARCSRVVVRDGSIEVVDAAVTQMFGTEGSYYDIDPVDCPTGSVLIGFAGSESNGGLVHHIRLRCASIEQDGGSVRLGSSAEVPENLGSPSSDGSGTGACPAGQLAAGIAGRAGSILDRFELRCYQIDLAPE